MFIYLKFRSLLESETLEFTAHCHYPIQWNDHQEWLFNLTGCKATGWFTYAHKGFFQGKFLNMYVAALLKIIYLFLCFY